MIDPENSHHAWWINGWEWPHRRCDGRATILAWEMNNLEELCAVMVRVPPKPRLKAGLI